VIDPLNCRSERGEKCREKGFLYPSPGFRSYRYRQSNTRPVFLRN
jgi:hypothetical protein